MMAAYRTVVHRIILAGIKERRLQNAGRKVDVVHLRIVISIHGGRTHPPFAAIHRFADLGNLAPFFKGIGRVQRVAERIAAGNGQRGVVTPFIRIADFIGNCMQLLFGASLGGRRSSS